MKKTIWNYQMPTLFGLVLLITGTLATSWIVKQGTSLISLADEANSPQHIRISNITDTKATISFVTEKPTISFVKIGTTQKPEETILDDRDKEANIPRERTIHYFTHESLIPETTYYFTIITGDQEFLDKDTPFQLITAKQLIPGTRSNQSITGKVLFPQNTAPEEIIVYVTGPTSQTLSVLSSTNGNYTLPLSSMRSKDLASFKVFEERDHIQLLLRGSTLSSAITYAYQQPTIVPDSLLSLHYDFTVANTPVENALEEELSFPSFTTARPLEKNPQIIVPKKAETFTDDQPQFEGVAQPNTSVDITINSTQQIKGKVVTDQNGTWSFRPTTPLEPGDHTITITTRDRFGIIKTITNPFKVYAQGSQFVEPSVSPIQVTPTIVPTRVPTATPTLVVSSPTPIPIQQVTIQPTPTTPVPTAIPTPVPVVQPLPPSGNLSLILFGSIISCITAIGILLFSFKHGKINV